MIYVNLDMMMGIKTKERLLGKLPLFPADPRAGADFSRLPHTPDRRPERALA